MMIETSLKRKPVLAKQGLRITKKASSELDKAFLLDVMTTKQKRRFKILVLFWLLNLLFMLVWWLNKDHVVDWFRFWLNTILLLYMLALPGYMFFFIARMKRVNPEIEIPKRWKVAMITTRSPSEPFSMAKVTLKAKSLTRYKRLAAKVQRF